ncbi:MAG: hypothetical protein HXX09_09060 [Bacteroidetes bacterium]|nr:hypothetical protein [Bacteroidota bacterium]
MKTQVILIFTFLVLIPKVHFGQSDSIQKRTLAKEDSLNIQIIRISECEKHKNYYYVINNKDSILFGNTDRCIAQDPLDYRESVKLDFRQLNKMGSSELILEYEYSGDHLYTGYHKEIIIINLDSMEIMFMTEIEARGQHFYGEELGEHYGFRYDLTFTDSGNIIIKKPTEKDEYFIKDGKYSPITKKSKTKN